MSVFKVNKRRLQEHFEIACVVVVAFSMFAYGFGKWVQFNDGLSVPKKVSELTGQELMWAFYGYSKPFVLILGFLEILGAVLLFFKRTRVFACLFLTVILINVILQDIFYDVLKGALIAAIYYQILIALILYFNRVQVLAITKVLFCSEFSKQLNKRSIKNRLFSVSAIICWVIIIFIIHRLIT